MLQMHTFEHILWMDSLNAPFSGNHLIFEFFKLDILEMGKWHNVIPNEQWTTSFAILVGVVTWRRMFSHSVFFPSFADCWVKWKIKQSRNWAELCWHDLVQSIFWVFFSCTEVEGVDSYPNFYHIAIAALMLTFIIIFTWL